VIKQPKNCFGCLAKTAETSVVWLHAMLAALIRLFYRCVHHVVSTLYQVTKVQDEVQERDAVSQSHKQDAAS